MTVCCCVTSFVDGPVTFDHVELDNFLWAVRYLAKVLIMAFTSTARRWTKTAATAQGLRTAAFLGVTRGGVLRKCRVPPGRFLRSSLAG